MRNRLVRWQNTANALGDTAIGLRLELHHLAANPTPHRLARAISAAFHLAERHGTREVTDMIAEMQDAFAS